MDPNDTGNPSFETYGGGADSDAASWRTEVGADYQRVAEKFTSPADVVKSYAELERKLGRSVEIPDAHASDEERAAFHKRLGVPESADGYDLAVPDVGRDGDADARLARYSHLAHEIGLTPQQAQAAVDWYYQEIAAATEAQAGQHARDAETAADTTADLEADLRKEWGSDYDRNMEYGRRALTTFGDAETVDKLERIVGDKQVVRMLARIGRRMGEAGDTGGGETLSDGRRNGHSQGLAQELDALMNRRDYWSNESVQRRVREINAQLHGSEPVTGTTPNSVFRSG